VLGWCCTGGLESEESEMSESEKRVPLGLVLVVAPTPREPAFRDRPPSFSQALFPSISSTTSSSRQPRQIRRKCSGRGEKAVERRRARSDVALDNARRDERRPKVDFTVAEDGRVQSGGERGEEEGVGRLEEASPSTDRTTWPSLTALPKRGERGE